MNNKLRPALIGGVLLGVLSIIPFVNFVNFCCCLWAILGGMLATNLYVKASPTPVTAGDGAVLGALAGVIGAAISLVIGIPINLLLGGLVNGVLISLLSSIDPGQARMMEAQILASQTVIGAIVNGLIASVLLLIFSVIGGLLGVPIFEKRKGGQPPPPPSTGGGPNAYSA